MWSILVETTFFKNIKIKLKNLGKKKKGKFALGPTNREIN